jgi:chromosome segregation ATPase
MFLRGEREVKKNLIIGLVVVALAVAAVVSFAVAQKQKKDYTVKITELSREKSAWDIQASEIKKQLFAKDEELKTARKQNFQLDLLAAQDALRQANERLTQLSREKSGFENTHLVSDNRLKNTTLELTKTLDELKKARVTLGNIEGQYKVKLDQLNNSLKVKDDEIRKFESKLGEKDTTSSGFKVREKDYSDALRKYQAQIAGLEKTVTDLNRALSEKEKIVAQKEANFEKYRRLPGAGRVAQVKADAESVEEKALLEKQISESSAKLFDQQEELEGLEKKVGELKDTLYQRELLLAKKDRDLKERIAEVESLRVEIRGLGAGRGYAGKTVPLLSDTQKELEARISQLESEKLELEDRLEAAQRKSSGRAGDKTESKNLFADRNFRILTETLVRKEEEIKQMETELEAFRREKIVRDSGSGLKEKRLVELEILVTTLTKQLGEYAGLIEQREREVKANSSKVASLMQEIEAQKVASIALQRELAEARVKQEKTFQSLTQIMSINADTGIPNTGTSVGDTSMSVGASSETDVNSAAGSGDVRKRAEELRRRVEVLLEGK